MDRKLSRNKKQKPHNARPYDRQNQGILGKVASKVKGLLNPSWLFNMTQWISSSNEEEPGCSTDFIDDTVDEEMPSRGSKRPRLKLDDSGPSILSAGTQTWLEPPSNLYDIASHVPPSASQSSLVEHKESSIAMNGDDHSENSEGSASTSGCSSLVSSHKGRLSCLPSSSRFGEGVLGRLSEDNIDLKNMRNIASPKGDVSNRTLWSSPFNSPRFQRRTPTIAQSNQPSFNISTFSGPSKLTPGNERKTASPFYEGKTTFGGASAIRRMPASVTPYQVEKSVRNQLRVREHHSEDSLEGMSSAAKKILLTLEKMSSPVMDAKKIPNTNKSPVDLSLYMTPPKHRRNSMFTPNVPSKGPPIANINTLSKLITLKNSNFKRQTTSMEIPVSSHEAFNTPNAQSKVNLSDLTSLQENRSSTNLLPSKNVTEKETLPSYQQRNTSNSGDFLQAYSSDSMASKGGGKMKNKLNQQHQSSKANISLLPDLPAFNAESSNFVPLSISKLPTITFGSNKKKLLILVMVKLILLFQVLLM